MARSDVLQMLSN